MSALEDTLLLHIKASGLPIPEREYHFARPRRFRFDFAWPDLSLAVEVEGGIWNRGRHGRGSGIAGDIEKGNLAVMKGWRVLRFHSGQITSGEAIKTLCEVFE